MPGVPMLKIDELIGVFMIYRLEVKPFTSKQIALVESFADQAVIAIENVRLFAEVQDRTHELTESLEFRLLQATCLASSVVPRRRSCPFLKLSFKPPAIFAEQIWLCSTVSRTTCTTWSRPTTPRRPL